MSKLVYFGRDDGIFSIGAKKNEALTKPVKTTLYANISVVEQVYSPRFLNSIRKKFPLGLFHRMIFSKSFKIDQVSAIDLCQPRFSIFANLCRSAGFLQTFAHMCRSAEFLQIFADMCSFEKI